MKKTAALILSLFMLVAVNAQEKKKSPPQSAEGKIGETMITIDYHSPSVRGRTIFGGLEKWGKVWRAGANEATTMEFSQDVTIDGEALKAGKYAFFVKPMENEAWEIIFNSEWKQWGAYNLDASKNVLTSSVKPQKIENKEELTYSISGGMIHLEWADCKISFKVE